MEDKQECANEGLSLREIFRTIWLRKWVTLGVALAIFLVCIISIFYGYNPSKKYYVMEFSLNLPGSDGGAVYVYPDGTQFHYTDIISVDTLRKVKDCNSDFASIDVDKMATNDNINITRTTVTEEKTNISETYYTLTAKTTYFSGIMQAKSFLMSLADTPKAYLSPDYMSIDYEVYLPMARDAVDYETEIKFLKSQLGVLQHEYDDLISEYGGNFVGNTESGKTLLAYSQEVKAYFDSGVLDNLLSSLRENQFIKCEECVPYYTDMLSTLKRERDVKQTALDNILKSDGTGSSVIIDTSVFSIAQEVAELDKQIVAIDSYIKNGTVKEGYLDEAYNKVAELTETFKTTCANVYIKASSVVYTQSGIVSTTGGFGTTTIVLLSLVVAVIVALIAGYVAGKLKLRSVNGVKNKADKVQTETLPDAECGEGNVNKKE